MFAVLRIVFFMSSLVHLTLKQSMPVDEKAHAGWTTIMGTHSISECTTSTLAPKIWKSAKIGLP